MLASLRNDQRLSLIFTASLASVPFALHPIHAVTRSLAPSMTPHAWSMFPRKSALILNEGLDLFIGQDLPESDHAGAGRACLMTQTHDSLAF